jgi:PAS domain S-box-containing protein
MHMSATQAIAIIGSTTGPSWGSGVFSYVELTLVSVIVLLVVLLVTMLRRSIRSERRIATEARRVVDALEALRSGSRPISVTTAPHSAIGPIGDAIGRISNEISRQLDTASAAEQRTDAVLKTFRDTAVVSTDLDGDIRSFNIGAIELFGWEEDEVLGKPAGLLFEENAYKDFMPQLARRSVRETGITAESMLLRRDGSAFPAGISVRITRGPAGEAHGFVMVVSDVTMQTALEDELRAAGKRYSDLVEGLVDGVAISQDGEIRFANRAFCRLCERPQQEVVGSLFRHYITTRDVMLVVEWLTVVQDDPGETAQIDVMFADPSGARQAAVSIQFSHIQHDGAPAVMLLVRDETASTRIESELRKNEARLDAVLEATNDGILVLADDSRDGLVRMANQAFVDLVGLDMDDILGASGTQLRRLLRRRGDGAELINALMESATGLTLRQVIKLGGATPKELKVTLLPLMDSSGRCVGRIISCRDLSEQRRAEQTLRESAKNLESSKAECEIAYKKMTTMNESLTGRLNDLDKLNSELHTLNGMKTNLLGNVSHELQTPLVAIRGYSEMILKERLGPISEEQRKGLTLSLKNIDRLISMIDDLLTFSRQELEIGELALTDFPLLPLVHEAAELLKQRMADRGIHFECDVDPDLAVRADRDKIVQVFVNLLTNAVKFNIDGGRITVSAQRESNDQLTVTVQDTGRGIKREELDQIFDRRYQVESDEGGSSEGSGIGLSIVRDFLRLHGCRIFADSQLGAGTTFSFRLPMAEQPER